MKETTTPLENSQLLHCHHCQLPVKRNTLTISGKLFCCYGCHSVYQLLKSNGLGDYYLYQQATANLRPNSLKDQPEKSFDYLDHLAIEKVATRLDDRRYEVRFYLDGINCMACVWLIEKLPDMKPGIEDAQLNFSNSTVTICFDQEQIQLSEVANFLHQLGHTPHLLTKAQKAQIFHEKEKRNELIRIGVAGACLGNIMLLAISNYAGADQHWHRLFNWLSFLLFLPVILFSAKGFYRSAWAGIKAGMVNIDFPVTVAVVIGTLVSLYHLTINSSHVYFDSLAALIFLLLSVRFILKQAQQKTMGLENLLTNLHGDKIKKKEGESFREAPITSLQKGDVILIEKGQTIPVDGVLSSGESYLDQSALNGEWEPSLAKEGQYIQSGCVNLAYPIELTVEMTSEESTLSKMFEKISAKWEANQEKRTVSNIADRASRYLLAVSFVLAIAVFSYLVAQGPFETALNRFLAIIVVACPCALALATPLTLTRAFHLLLAKGILIKNENVIFNLSRVKAVFLDKTGTLTDGRYSVSNWEGDQDLHTVSAIYHLLSRSRHPVATSLAKYILDRFSPQTIEIRDYQETCHVGVSGKIGTETWEIRGNQGTKNKTSLVYRNQALVAKIEMHDQVITDAKAAISFFKNAGLNPKLLSGDNEQETNRVGKLLGLGPDALFSQKSPNQKAHMVSGKKALMLGDGVNDVYALKSAMVGVAAQGGLDVNLGHADVCLTQKSPLLVTDMLILSKRAMRITYFNLAISLLFNTAGMVLAATGLIGPLGAAVLMPISSITVLLLATFGLRRKAA